MNTSILLLSSSHNNHASIKYEHAFYSFPNFETKKKSDPNNHIDIHIYVLLSKNVWTTKCCGFNFLFSVP